MLCFQTFLEIQVSENFSLQTLFLKQDKFRAENFIQDISRENKMFSFDFERVIKVELTKIIQNPILSQATPQTNWLLRAP